MIIHMRHTLWTGISETNVNVITSATRTHAFNNNNILYRIVSFYCLNLFFRFIPLHGSLLLVNATYELRLIILLFPPDWLLLLLAAVAMFVFLLNLNYASFVRHCPTTKQSIIEFVTGKYLALQYSKVFWDWDEPQIVGKAMTFRVKVLDIEQIVVIIDAFS